MAFLPKQASVYKRFIALASATGSVTALSGAVVAWATLPWLSALLLSLLCLGLAIWLFLAFMIVSTYH